MAKKKTTQAQRISASQNGRSYSDSKEETEKTEKRKKKLSSDKKAVPSEKKKNPYSRLVFAGVYLLLFFVFLVIALNQKGFVLTFIRSAVFGLFGPVTFYLSVPAMFYLFTLHAFPGKRPVALRSSCMLSSLFLVGCISHITMSPQLSHGLSQVTELYTTGTNSASGGVLCGLVGGFLKDALSAPLALILLSAAAIVCLMSAFGLTIPSLIVAFQQRPRFEDEEDLPVRPDPASVLVNSMTVKQHEIKQKRQMKKMEELQNPKPNAPIFQTPWRRAPQESAVDPDKRGQEILREIADGVPQNVNMEVPVPSQEPSGPSPMSALTPENYHIVSPSPIVSEPVETQSVPELLEPIVLPSEPVIPEDREMIQSVAAEPGIADPVPCALSATSVEPANKKVTAQEAAESAQEVTQEIAQNLQHNPEEKPVYTFPSIDLLRQPSGGIADGTGEMRENTRRLNDTLSSFKIDAHVTNVTRGPSVTRYEVELMQGVRLSKLTSVADDIALSLGTSGVRIAPVPNKISVVGIEVPNQAVTTVTLREVVGSDAFHHAKSSASFAVGKDISGTCIVGNITKLPHMLIAGTTGSGKSVCMNSIILSLLYKASPEDVRLIMVDPKMVELGIYNGIPHLLIPVVTDPKKAAGSLQWAVTEMMRRYRLMSEAGVRDLESYNELIANGSMEGEHMAQVVVIIDELADLMLVAAKEVEESICRIAQMGRASGIHLIIATQRPSADVITGLMKANIPSRIAFAVASAMESRIILDNSGAEKLVGKGDMLYAPIGCGKPIRVQGCFVSDGEVEAVATYVKTHYSNTYDEKVLQEIEQNAAKTGSSKNSSTSDIEPSADEMSFDEMLIPAVDAVLQVQQASVSMLQRKLKLGFSRAARIVDTMEELGIVGEHAGSKPRQILVTPDQWAQMKIALTGGQVPSVPDLDEIPTDSPVPEQAMLGEME